jgi:hypothetical protein
MCQLPVESKELPRQTATGRQTCPGQAAVASYMVAVVAPVRLFKIAHSRSRKRTNVPNLTFAEIAA